MDGILDAVAWAINLFEAGLNIFGLVAGVLFLLGLAWAVATD